MVEVTVLGSGSWGTALSQHFAKNGVKVRLWGRDEAQYNEILSQRTNSEYLPGISLSDNILPVLDLEEAVKGTQVIVLCLPSSETRNVLDKIRGFNISDEKFPPIISTAKGLEKTSNRRVSQVIEEVFGSNKPCFVFSGPSFALEVAQSLPTALVLAKGKAGFEKEFEFCTRLFHKGNMRVYSSTDLIGVELGGILKNIIAIASGIGDGLKLGLSGRAALLTRGLRELIRLIEAEGGQRESVIGLSGLGDLILTSTGDLSRNRTFGILLGEGLTIEEAKKKVGQTIEAFTTSRSAYELARKKEIEVPIIEQISKILEGRKKPFEAFAELMTREQKAE